MSWSWRLILRRLSAKQFSFSLLQPAGTGRFLLRLLALWATTLHAAQMPASEVVDYQQQIRPLLVARCIGCHGPRKQQAGLRLDAPAALRRGGDSGSVIVPGDSGQSLLLQRVVAVEAGKRMPPRGVPLSVVDIQLLRDWIDQGAVMPALVAETERHWAFRRPRQHSPRAVEDLVWGRNPVDQFILARLEAEAMRPARDASVGVRTRRVYLDLLGLLPSWQTVKQQQASRDPDRFERLVDHVLASPRYGERWGRHWLDLARYADSTGYESDRPRVIWMYRDWVIDALNQDLRFDQFVRQQVAGDLYPAATPSQRIATGFFCNGMYDPGVRWEHIIDRLNTVGTVFLGLTLGCAQCHDHKTDPLSQHEFYQLYAFLNEAKMTTVRREHGKLIAHPPPDSATTGNKPADEIMTTEVLQHAAQPTHVFVRGDPAQPGTRVVPGFPAFLWNLSSKATKQNPDRLDLADWLVAEQNPLTARVTVNRVWQRLFGLGLVPTENDFGMQTPPPSHPALLDHLAIQLQRPYWRGLKSLLRTLVTSATYRQASAVHPQFALRDPDNRWVSRQRRLRLEAEVIRDVWLQAGTRLSSKMGGRSVFPEQVAGVLENRATPATWTPSQGEDRYRRGLYTWVWRLTPHPMLPLFDAPDGVAACTNRDRSNVPVQALSLLNDPALVECAQSLARSVAHGDRRGDSDRLESLMRICLSREAHPIESKVLLPLLQQQRSELRADLSLAAQIVAQSDAEPRSQDAVWVVETAAWTVVARVVMNLDEFITRE
ncbi:MAG: hypothetical protein CMJ75_20980 [Planctomycetaceae bacterium]|nr:hypothetical protein [Planctomycetaceae bacterium]